jgi:hypothetical protein
MVYEHKGKKLTPKKCEDESFVDIIQLNKKNNKGPTPKKQKEVECSKELGGGGRVVL